MLLGSHQNGEKNSSKKRTLKEEEKKAIYLICPWSLFSVLNAEQATVGVN